jgi:hypothetical protein
MCLKIETIQALLLPTDSRLYFQHLHYCLFVFSSDDYYCRLYHRSCLGIRNAAILRLPFDYHYYQYHLHSCYSNEGALLSSPFYCTKSVVFRDLCLIKERVLACLYISLSVILSCSVYCIVYVYSNTIRCLNHTKTRMTMSFTETPCSTSAHPFANRLVLNAVRHCSLSFVRTLRPFLNNEITFIRQ